MGKAQPLPLKADLEVVYMTSLYTCWSELRWPHLAAEEAGICGLWECLVENLFLLKENGEL